MRDITSMLRMTARIAPESQDGWTRLNGDCRGMLNEAAAEIDRLRDIIRRRLACEGSGGTWDAAKNSELSEEMRAVARPV
jgi:hypothetical protein